MIDNLAGLGSDVRWSISAKGWPESSSHLYMHTHKKTCYAAESTEVIKEVFTLTNNYYLSITDAKQVNIFFFSLFCFTVN